MSLNLFHNSLTTEQNQIKRADSYKQHISKLQSQIHHIETEYNVRKQACELLMGSIRSLSFRFNYFLEEYTDETLMLFCKIG